MATQQRPEIRGGTPADVAALAVIWQDMMAEHAGRDSGFALARDALDQWRMSAAEMAERPDAFLAVARLDNEPAGFCIGWIALNPAIYSCKEIGFVSEVAVAPWARRRGVGRELIAHARRWFRAHGLNEFQLATAVWNDSAQAFWRSVGGQPFLVRYRFSV